MSVDAREALKARLDADKRDDFEWLMRQLDGPSIMPIFGYITAIAVEHQDSSFWEILREARAKFKQIVPV